MTKTLYKDVPIHHFEGWRHDNCGWLTEVTGNTLYPTVEAAQAAIDGWWADPDRVQLLPSITHLSLTALFPGLAERVDKGGSDAKRKT